MIEHVFLLGVGIACFLTCSMNALFSDKFWFCILVAVVGLVSIPLSFVIPTSTFAFFLAMTWQLVVILIGRRLDLGKYRLIPWLYAFLMGAILIQWGFWTQGTPVFDQTYLNISIGCNIALVLLLLVFSDYGSNLINKIRNRRWLGDGLDASNSAKHIGR